MIQKKQNKKNKYISLVNALTVILSIGISLYLTVIHNSNYFLKLQDLSLFLPTKMFLIETIEAPGGFLCYLGLFFTQFFFHPWLGALCLMFFLILVQFLSYKAFNLKEKIFPLSFIPSLLLLLSITQLGYNIFILYARGYVFSGLIGVSIVVGSFLFYKNLLKLNQRILFSTLFLIAFFHLIGFYSLFALLLFIAFELVTMKRDNRITHLKLVGYQLVLLLVMPLVYARFSIVTLYPYVYISGLPGYRISGNLTLFYPLLGLFILLLFFNLNFLKIKVSRFFNVLPVVVFLVAVFSVYHFSYNDENFRTELAMDKAISENNWELVLELSEQVNGEPTRLIVMNTYLALRKLHLAGDKMFTVKNGNKRFKTKVKVLLMDVAGKMFYYHYGKSNFCYRWSMEDMMTNGMKIENLKFFVKSCLLNNEFELAEKYNKVLSKTFFHKEWAKKHQVFIDHPELIKKDPEFKEIIPLLDYENKLISDDPEMLESFLLYDFATLNSGTAEMMEIALQSILEYKNKKAFWPCFFNYLETHSTIPIHYQEAALLFYIMDKNVDISNIKFDDKVLQRIKQFAKLNKQYSNASEEKKKLIFKKKFGDTYWYYYNFFERVEKY